MLKEHAVVINYKSTTATVKCQSKTACGECVSKVVAVAPHFHNLTAVVRNISSLSKALSPTKRTNC